MRRQLLDSSEGLWLKKTRSEALCVYSGDSIPSGAHAVRAMFNNGTKTYGVWIDMASVDGLYAAFDSFDEEDAEIGQELSPSGVIKYNEIRGQTLRCLICDEHMPKDTLGISMCDSSGHVATTVWSHVGCLDRFCEGLDEVWEYSEELLIEQV